MQFMCAASGCGLLANASGSRWKRNSILDCVFATGFDLEFNFDLETVLELGSVLKTQPKCNFERKSIMETECIINSLGGQRANATIVRKIGDNQYESEYNGVRCTAIFNPFSGYYYVDDVYGIL